MTEKIVCRKTLPIFTHFRLHSPVKKEFLQPNKPTIIEKKKQGTKKKKEYV